MVESDEDNAGRPTRWQKAVDDTEFFRWKREVSIGLVAGVFAVLALALFADGDDVKAEVIVLGSALAAMVALPLAELFWNWLQVPMRMLTEDVALLRRDVLTRASTPQTSAVERPEIQSAIHALLDELITIRARLHDVRADKEFSPDFFLPNVEWTAHRDLLAKYVPAETRRLVGTIYVNADRVNGYAQSLGLDGGELTDQSRAAVEAIIEEIGEALDALTKEVQP